MKHIENFIITQKIGMKKINLKIIAIILSFKICNVAAENSVIRVAVLKYGSVNWELDVVERYSLDKKQQIKIIKREMTNKDAATIAFLSGSVDIFVTDWIWASKQRSKGNLVKFSPFSSAAGGLLVKKTSDIKTLADLKNKKVGVAGGSLDKSWLFFRAYMLKTQGNDPMRFLKPAFAAPPLVNGLIENGELDAAFNYWNYAARLEASGFSQIISVAEMLPSLGINKNLPLIGYVFKEDNEEESIELVNKFLSACSEAREILNKSDKEWFIIKKLTGAENDLMLSTIRDKFRAGIPNITATEIKESLQSAYKVLGEIGGKKLIGKHLSLAEGTLWKP